MAQKLQLYIPTKPFKVTQAWGILNPIYKPYGYTRHAGTDLRIDDDVQVEAMCYGRVREVGYNPSNGNFVRYRSNLANVGGKDCYVDFVYLHASKILVKSGEEVYPGKPLILAGNTGKSTGPHTHIGAWRVDMYGNRLDKNEADGTFDWTKYLVNYYSADVWQMIKEIWARLKII